MTLRPTVTPFAYPAATVLFPPSLLFAAYTGVPKRSSGWLSQRPALSALC